ncbi:uncharacterized protein BDR25DRAFT_304533 [Lindgomyces ingoldianus]|uniref:Uncharacterized protein n=1 Tax=Lindgomyces ingoldianus TaxID=673940 RepID=A0ACB6QTH2_9PLEO|nr:uncharacterized protein BDR25DRAFT_304533 [Lindgomyces ingoldianus]KAF2469461.1 hypothetical protein BDR25DRAFT_304533 [Lindgomyces ingoldianus]
MSCAMLTASREQQGRRYNVLGNSADTKRSPRLDLDLLLSIRRRLDEAAETHRKLVTEREKLLIHRENVRSAATKVRSRRIGAGNAEADFMNLLRGFTNQFGHLFTSHLITAYQKVQEARDALGTVEEDYLCAERSLGGFEWTFIDKENDFYQYELQDLFSDEFLDQYSHINAEEPRLPPGPVLDTVPSSTVVRLELQAALAKLNQLRTQFNALRPQQARYLEEKRAQKRHKNNNLTRTTDTEFVTRYSAFLAEISDQEVKAQHLKLTLMQHEASESVIARRSSDPCPFDGREMSFDIVRRAQTDGAVSTLLENAAFQHRTHEWILERLKGDPLEKTIYLNILAQFGVPHTEHESWEDRATQYWPHDMSEQPLQTIKEPFSVSHHTIQSPNQNTSQSSQWQYPSDNFPSTPRKPKLRLNFEDNFNYAPAPSLEYDEPQEQIRMQVPPLPLPGELRSQQHLKSITDKSSKIPALRIVPTDAQDVAPDPKSPTSSPLGTNRIL